MTKRQRAKVPINVLPRIKKVLPASRLPAGLVAYHGPMESLLRLCDVSYLCSKCAKKLKGKWPKGHCATVHSAPCDACGRIASLASTEDWLWGNEKTLANWD